MPQYILTTNTFFFSLFQDKQSKYKPIKDTMQQIKINKKFEITIPLSIIFNLRRTNNWINYCVIRIILH